MRRFEREAGSVAVRKATAVTIVVSGALDGATVSAVTEALNALDLRSEPRPIVVDLSAVTFLDAPAVRTLVSLVRDARRSDRALLFDIHPDGRCKKVLEALRAGPLDDEVQYLNAASGRNAR